MQRIPSFDPGDTVTYPNGNGPINVGAADAGAKLLLYNESPYNLDIDFLNGNVSILHAWEARYWTLDGDTRQVEWIIDTVLNVTTPPISLVMGELYGSHETIEGAYPMALIRQASVGNQVSTSVASSQTLVNTGNPSSTNVVTVNSTAAVGNTLTLTNDGLLMLAATIAGVLQTVLQTFEPAAGGKVLQEGVATYLTEQLGNLKVDGTLESVGTLTADGAMTVTGLLTATNNANSLVSKANAVPATGVTAGALPAGVTLPATQLTSGAVPAGVTVPGGQVSSAVASANVLNAGVNLSAGKLGKSADGDVLDASGATSIFIKNPTANTIQFQVPNGTNICYIDGTGLHLNAAGTPSLDMGSNGQIKYANGNVATRWGVIGGTGSGTFNHGLGAAPSWLAPIVNVAGSATQGFDTITSTQVHITMGATISWSAFEFK